MFVSGHMLFDCLDKGASYEFYFWVVDFFEVGGDHAEREAHGGEVSIDFGPGEEDVVLVDNVLGEFDGCVEGSGCEAFRDDFFDFKCFFVL